MMEWLVALAIFVTLAIGLPFLLTRPGRKGNWRKRMGLVGGGLDASFAVLDPARARAQQIIEVRQEIGDADEGDHGDPIDRVRRDDGGV
jgi:hypothetical protein